MHSLINNILNIRSHQINGRHFLAKPGRKVISLAFNFPPPTTNLSAKHFNRFRANGTCQTSINFANAHKPTHAHTYTNIQTRPCKHDKYLSILNGRSLSTVIQSWSWANMKVL